MKTSPIYKLVLTALLAAMACVATMVIRVPTVAGYTNLGDCVPGTFVIKGLVALIAAFMVRPILKKDEKLPFWKLALCELPSEAFMVAGYFGYKALILQKGLAAAASIPNNLVQGALGIALSVLLYTVLCRVPDVHKTFWKGV